MGPSSWTPIAEGLAGIRQIVANLNAAKDYYGSLPAIRAAALAIATPTVDDDDRGNVNKIAAFVRSSVVYVKDPINSELTQTPDVLLLAIHNAGTARGDCDDHVLLFASLVESLGIFCSIVGVKTPDSETFNHVIALAYPDGEEEQVDLCAKTGQQPFYPDTLT
jgi:hypothetical protein